MVSEAEVVTELQIIGHEVGEGLTSGQDWWKLEGPRQEGLKCHCLVTEEGQGSLMGSASLRDLEAGTRGAGRLLR